MDGNPSVKSERKAALPTIQRVADAAGVSCSTVSRSFARPELLSARTVAHVRRCAEALGYVPSKVAQALSTGRTGNIALVVPDIANPFFPPLIRAVQTTADRAGFSVFIGDGDETAEREERLLTKLAGQVDGFVLVSPRLPSARLAAHGQRRPMVLVNRDQPGLTRVLIDSALGIEAAVAHLHELGHRRIGYIAGPATSWSNQERNRAIHRAAIERSMEVKLIPDQRPTFEGGVAAAQQVIAAGTTAAIAFDDLMAQGLMAGLAQAEIRVPTAFSVIGCDDVLGVRTIPQLTTISSRSAEAGELATRLLLDILSGAAARPKRRVLDSRLIGRASTGPAVNLRLVRVAR